MFTNIYIVPPDYANWLIQHDIKPGGGFLPKWSVEDALNMMDEHSIATGILSVSTPGVHLGNDAEARVKAREVNEFAAQVVSDHPHRFGFFATLTLPDVDGAIAEAVYAMEELHAAGVVLLANTHGRYLGEKDFDPLMQELNRRHAVVFVHPSELPGLSVQGVPSFAADFLLDTTRAAINLIVSGTMTGAVIIREPSVRLFEAWGVSDRFYAEAVQTKVIEVLDSNGKAMGTTPADMTGEGNAYSVHRADVHALLLEGVDQQHIHLGMESVEVFEDGDRGVVRFAEGRQVRAKVVIGADGIKSVVRKFIHNDDLIFSKLVILRGLAPSTAMPEDMPNDRMYLWGQTPKMLTLLPLRGGNEVAMDSIMVQDTPPQDLWTSEVPISELLDFFKGFDPAMIKLIEAGTVPVRANPVYEREPIDTWSSAYITLLGDAAHPMAPRAGSGGKPSNSGCRCFSPRIEWGRNDERFRRTAPLP